MEPDLPFFGIRNITAGEVSRRVHHTRTMLFASAVASLAIVGLGAFFVSLWF